METRNVPPIAAQLNAEYGYDPRWEESSGPVDEQGRMLRHWSYPQEFSWQRFWRGLMFWRTA